MESKRSDLLPASPKFCFSFKSLGRFRVWAKEAICWLSTHLKILTVMRNSCWGLPNAILSHGNGTLTLGAEEATLMCGISRALSEKEPECVCPQTSPKRKETRISCWQPRKRAASRTSQPNFRPAFTEARKQDLTTNHQRSPQPLRGDTLLLLSNSNKAQGQVTQLKL